MNMKIVILAGGFGTRLSEFTDLIPKPMVEIGGKPILVHIMEHYMSYGFNDFVIALGYKQDYVKTYFSNYRLYKNDFSIDFYTDTLSVINQKNLDFKMTLVDTGLNTMTGGRLKRLSKILGDQTFMMTYGDGLCDVDISKLVDFHKNHKKMITMTAVRPNARFGEIKFENDIVSKFEEKPQLHDGWINGGFFVINSSFLDFIVSDEIMLEREPLSTAASMKELVAFRHEGFWQCMDSKKDYDYLQSLLKDGKAPWLKG